jgi:hypothetical protein
VNSIRAVLAPAHRTAHATHAEHKRLGPEIDDALPAAALAARRKGKRKFYGHSFAADKIKDSAARTLRPTKVFW